MKRRGFFGTVAAVLSVPFVGWKKATVESDCVKADSVILMGDPEDDRLRMIYVDASGGVLRDEYYNLSAFLKCINDSHPIRVSRLQEDFLPAGLRAGEFVLKDWSLAQVAEPRSKFLPPLCDVHERNPQTGNWETVQRCFRVNKETGQREVARRRMGD